MKTDPCPYLVRYSPEEENKSFRYFLYKQKCFIKNNVRSSPQEIWILDKDMFS